MIITRTPLRISLVGGGTDFPEFYIEHGGAVISMAINKYIYISINNKFDGKYRLSYSRTELVDRVEELEHDLARSCLETFYPAGLEITSVADIPGSGSGLGSSSAFVVGLLLALSQHCCFQRWSPKTLAEMAFLVENRFCGHVLGKQDQYAAAYGGLHYYEFVRDGAVRVEPLCLTPEQVGYIDKHLLMFWTGVTRQADEILRLQRDNYHRGQRYIQMATQMRELTISLRDEIQKGNLDAIGDHLDRNWKLKRQLAVGITNETIDDAYQMAIRMGASGGKLCGAGGGGFLVFWADPGVHKAVCDAIGLRRIAFSMAEKGSRIIFNGEEYEK